MARRLTIELSEGRAREAAKVGEQLGLTLEQVVQLSLNVCLREWRDILPELGAHDEPVDGGAAFIVRH